MYIINSPRKNKRFRIIMDDNTYYDFGLLGGQTYIDHKDKIKRDNYIKRHYNNPLEKYLIDNLIYSPSLFSMYLLWGPFTNINDNLNYLNKLLSKNKN